MIKVQKYLIMITAMLILAMAPNSFAQHEEHGAINLEDGPALEEIGTQELQGLIQKGDPMILVDARGPEAYAQERLPRAINIPADQIAVTGPHVSKEAEIVVYCGGPKCPHSRIVAQWFVGNGWKRVRHYAGGMLEWREAGYPLEGTGLPVTQGGA